MKEIETLISGAHSVETLIDIANVFGSKLQVISPEAKKMIYVRVFKGKPPVAYATKKFKEAWEVVKDIETFPDSGFGRAIENLKQQQKGSKTGFPDSGFNKLINPAGKS